MPLSLNEIRDRALAFSRDWADATEEDPDAKSFWDAFFNVFGIDRRRMASFEKRVKKIDGKDGYIDLLWKGVLLVEHKSRGKDLDRAFEQAKDYFPGIKDRELPRYVIVSDFARLRLYDLDEDRQWEFALAELREQIGLFGFMSGYRTIAYREQDPVNLLATQRLGDLHERLKEIGYAGHALEVFLVRVLFCLFAEDTGIFERRQFQDLIELRTAEDGQDLAHWLGHLFEVLDTPPERRLKTLDEQLAAFPYVNGALYAERLPTAAFDRAMRDTLLECCALDWGRISPAIFGSLFQSVLAGSEDKRQQRRRIGAHYTTEKNILKLIGPLFLDGLKAELERIRRQPRKVREFLDQLRQLTFLDPACGCGNFLVIAYRELRLLEMEALHILSEDSIRKTGQFELPLTLCNVDQFFGIEIEEFPAQIAQTALWMMDHQMNTLLSVATGRNCSRLPLKTSATIVHGNALRLDWREVVKPETLSYILGNPPFGGKQFQSDEQKQDLARVFCDDKGAGVLDFVAPWYRKAAEFMAANQKIKSAFVSTNSVTQGEQVGALWPGLLKRGVKIHFAHRTFQWSSEARGKAAVHCVIVGFALHDATEKRLFDYETPQAEAHEVKANNINPYLVDAADLVLTNRRAAISKCPPIVFGSMPNDGGHLLLSPDEKRELLKREPKARKWVRMVLGSEEFLNGQERFCLWLQGIPPDELRLMPSVTERVEAVRAYRLASRRPTTNELARSPAIFGEIRHPASGDYLLIPSVSSERRPYIPIGLFHSDVVSTNLNLIVPGGQIYHLGVLSSAMHMAWVRSVCGRLKSDYRYSAGIVYNNFPWPEEPTPKQRQTIETAAQAVLDARAQHPGASLATLYDPLTMPPNLAKAHRKLDTAVDAAYAKRKFSGDSDRVAFLFERYRELTAAPPGCRTP